MIKFCYNPFKKTFLHCRFSHALAINNPKKYDAFIRCIVDKKTLYIRIFHPFLDIYHNKPLNTIKAESLELLKDYENILKKLIKKHYNISIKNVKFNVTNDLLKNKLKINNI